MDVEKMRNHLIRFLAFRQAGLVPESMSERFEDDQLCIVSSTKECTMQDSGAAQHHVARAGEKKGGRHSAEI